MADESNKIIPTNARIFGAPNGRAHYVLIYNSIKARPLGELNSCIRGKRKCIG